MQIERSGGLWTGWFESEFSQSPTINVICDTSRMARGCLADLDHKIRTTRPLSLSRPTSVSYVMDQHNQIQSHCQSIIEQNWFLGSLPKRKQAQKKYDSTPPPSPTHQANNHEIQRKMQIWPGKTAADQRRSKAKTASYRGQILLGQYSYWLTSFLSLPSLHDLWSRLFTAFLDTVEDSFAYCYLVLP